MANKSDRTPSFNVRTTQMSDEMYGFVLDKNSEHGSFREYVFHLIQKDMDQQQQEKINKEKDKHVYDILLELKQDMGSQFKHLNRKIEKKSFVGSAVLPVNNSVVADDEEQLEIKEGQLVHNAPPTGEIEEEYDMDF